MSYEINYLSRGLYAPPYISSNLTISENYLILNGALIQYSLYGIISCK